VDCDVHRILTWREIKGIVDTADLARSTEPSFAEAIQVSVVTGDVGAVRPVPGYAEYDVADLANRAVADPQSTGAATWKQADRTVARHKISRDDLHIAGTPPPTFLNHTNSVLPGVASVFRGACDITSVSSNHSIRSSFSNDLPTVEVNRPIGERLDQIEIVRHEDHGDPCQLHPRQPV
jgi:hypothetical protein